MSGCSSASSAVIRPASETGPAPASGLSIVAAVVASHHGQAWVESEPGHGARFRVELPLMGFTENSQGVRIGS